jgi:hypothetical protein
LDPLTTLISLLTGAACPIEKYTKDSVSHDDMGRYDRSDALTTANHIELLSLGHLWYFPQPPSVADVPPICCSTTVVTSTMVSISAQLSLSMNVLLRLDGESEHKTKSIFETFSHFIEDFF